MKMEGWWKNVSKPGDAAHSLSPSRINAGELLDLHKQLRHENGGLKLQLAAKQEVLERSVALIDTLTNELTQAKFTIDSQQRRIRELAAELEKCNGGEQAVQQEQEKSSAVGQHELHQHDAILKAQPVEDAAVASEFREEREGEDELVPQAKPELASPEPSHLLPQLLHQQQPTTLHVDVASVDSTQNLEVSTTFVGANEGGSSGTTPMTENDNSYVLPCGREENSIEYSAVPSFLYNELQIAPPPAAVEEENENGSLATAAATNVDDDEEEEYRVSQSAPKDALSIISDETAAMRKRVEDARARFAQIESFGALPPPLPKRPFGGSELSPACRITMAARAATPRGGTS